MGLVGAWAEICLMSLGLRFLRSGSMGYVPGGRTQEVFDVGHARNSKP